jgi:hypothetical protein
MFRPASWTIIRHRTNTYNTSTYANKYLEFASSQILQSYLNFNVTLNCKYLTLPRLFQFVKITAVKITVVKITDVKIIAVKISAVK